MQKEPIMTDLDILYHADYLEYQDFFTEELGFAPNIGTILFISAIKGGPFREIRGGGIYLEELIQNGTDRLLREEIYVSKEDKSYRVVVNFNKNGIKKYKNISEISIEELLEELENCVCYLGNAPEIIRLLRMQGNNLKADYIETKYQYFLANKNRVPEIKEKVIKEDKEEIKRLKALPDIYEEIEDDILFEE